MKTHFWTNEYGKKIYCVSQKTTQPEKGCIGFVHGLGEHILRYHHVFDFFKTHGYSVYGFDTFGHGRSQGKKGHVNSLSQLMSEIQMLTNWMQSESQAPKILYGHSMGGLKVLTYLTKTKKLPDLAVVTSPFIRQAKPEPRLKVMAGKLASALLPKKTINNGLVVEGISRDLEEVEAYKKDPYNHPYISLKLATISFNEAEKLDASVEKIAIPVLLQHGTDDMLTSHHASEKLAHRWGVDFRSWQGGYHELHNDLEKEAFLQFTLQWIEKHLPK